MKKGRLKTRWFVILFLLAALTLFIWNVWNVKVKPVWVIKNYLKSSYSTNFAIEYVSGSFCDDTTTYRVTPMDNGRRCFYLILKGRSEVISDTFLLAQLSDELVNIYSEELAAVWGSCTVYLSLESVPLSRVPLMDIAGMTLMEQLAYTSNLYQTIYIQPDMAHDRRLAEQKYQETAALFYDLNQEMQCLSREWLKPVVVLSEPDGNVVSRESASDTLEWVAERAQLEELLRDEGIHIGPDENPAGGQG